MTAHIFDHHPMAYHDIDYLMSLQMDGEIIAVDVHMKELVSQEPWQPDFQTLHKRWKELRRSGCKKSEAYDRIDAERFHKLKVRVLIKPIEAQVNVFRGREVDWEIAETWEPNGSAKGVLTGVTLISSPTTKSFDELLDPNVNESPALWYFKHRLQP